MVVRDSIITYIDERHLSKKNRLVKVWDFSGTTTADLRHDIAPNYKKTDVFIIFTWNNDPSNKYDFLKTNIAFWQRQSWKNDTKYHMLELKIGCIYNSSIHQKMPLRENSPNTEFFLVLGIRIGWNWIFLTKYRNFDGLRNTLWILALFLLMCYKKCSFSGSENNSNLDTF